MITILDERVITRCPAFREDNEEHVTCGAPLEVVLVAYEIGDERGGRVDYDISFRCNHSFEDMRKALTHEE